MNTSTVFRIVGSASSADAGLHNGSTEVQLPGREEGQEGKKCKKRKHKKRAAESKKKKHKHKKCAKKKKGKKKRRR